MLICFLGLNCVFDFKQIGGTDSFMRRLINELLKQNVNLKIKCIFYSAFNEEEVSHNHRLSFIYFKTFKKALHYISQINPEQVICTYILPKDRINFAIFREKHKKIKFNNIIFFYPESPLKRFIKFLEFRLFPYNGKVFCISNRQYKYLKRFCNNAVYLLPPVPEDYFLNLEDKPLNDRIKITFLGRIDPRKGINEVIEIFRSLKDNPIFECEIYGIHIPQDKDALNIHNWLKSQNKIKYVELERQGYSPEVEEMVKKVLKNTDILIQPYKNLDSTVDTPLLLLESMASLCAFMTTPVGNIPEIYRDSEFVINYKKFVPESLKLLQNLSYATILEERKKIFKRINELECRSSKIAKLFLDYLEE